MKRLLFALLFLLGPLPVAAATCPGYTYTLQNGQIADANQVMANFNTIANCVNNNVAHNGANFDITSLNSLTTPLTPAQGGTGTTGAAGGALSGTYPNPSLTNAGVIAAIGYTPLSSTAAAGGSLSGNYPNPSLALASTSTVIANISGGSAAPSAVALSAFTPQLTVFAGDAGSGGTAGIVPAPPAGSAVAGKFLSANGSFAVPAPSLPTGAIIMYAANAAPTGYLNCNGQAVSRTTYATLYGVIGTTYGAGDGSTTFNVPNFLGVFPRGYDSSGAIDPGRTFGSTQQDAMQGHYHTSLSGGTFVVNPISSSSANVTTGGGHFQDDNTTGAPVTDGTHGTPRTASETRPINLAVFFAIKTAYHPSNDNHRLPRLRAA